jgi:hypothetical protein
MPSDYEI